MISSKNSFISTYLSVGLIFVIMIGVPSCKSKKKLAEISNESTVEVPEPVEEEIPAPMEEEVIENPEKRVAVYEPTLSERLDDHFLSIARATTVSSANMEIQEALQLFSTGNAPVLIIFYQANGQEDYDEPTTIEKYLNYLKDTRKSTAKVEEMVMDDYGRIKELVLVRK